MVQLAEPLHHASNDLGSILTFGKAREKDIDGREEMGVDLWDTGKRLLGRGASF